MQHNIQRAIIVRIRDALGKISEIDSVSDKQTRPIQKTVDHRDGLQPRDKILAIFFAVLACLVSAFGYYQTLRHRAFFCYYDIWFQADIPRVIENLTNSGGDHSRTTVHPLSSILLYPFGYLLSKMNLSALHAAFALNTGFMALNSAFIYIILRKINLPKFVSCVFSTLFIASAAFIYWSSVIELYAAACFTIILSIFMVSLNKVPRKSWWVVMSALTLSITITNWSAGLIATYVRWRLKWFLLISCCALICVMGLSVVQHETFTNAKLFFKPSSFTAEAAYSEVAAPGTIAQSKWTPLANLSTLFTTTIVASPSRIEKQDDVYVVTNQSLLSYPTIIGKLGVVAWLGLLILGAWGAIKNKDQRVFSVSLGLMLLFNGLLHLVYGSVTFLYSLHVLPMLISLAAMSWFSPYRRLGLGLACVVIILGGYNNCQQFQRSIDLTEKAMVLTDAANINQGKTTQRISINKE